MPLPNMNELQTMFGAWNPQAYLTGQENLGLERQLVNEDLNKKRQDTRKVELENLFSEQDNPNRIQERVLTNEGRALDNTGKGYSNRQAKLETERKEANFFNTLAEDQRNALLKATEDDYKLADAQAEVMIRHPDPKIQEKGLLLSNLTKSAREAKLKFDREMEQERYKQTQETGRALERMNHEKEVERYRAANRLEVAGTRTGGTTIRPPRNAEEAQLRQYKDQLDRGAITQEQYEELVTALMNTVIAAKVQAATQGITTKVDPTGGIKIENKSGAPTVAARPTGSREASGKVTERTGQTANGVKFKVVD